MFFGTKMHYKILYFLTAMSPSYVLFILQLNEKFPNMFPIKFSIFGKNLHLNSSVSICIALLLIMILGIFLKKLLIYQYKYSSTDEVLGNDKKLFSSSNIENRNSGVVSFLLGNILPAVIVVGDSVFCATIVFVSFQIILYVLIMASTDVFPNIILIILKMNICETEDGRVVFVFRSNKFKELKIYQIGDPNKSKTYITMYNKRGIGRYEN